VLADDLQCRPRPRLQVGDQLAEVPHRLLATQALLVHLYHDVARLQARLAGRLLGQYLFEDDCPLVDLQLPRQGARHFVQRHPQVAAPHLPLLQQLVGDLLDRVARNREADPLAVAVLVAGDRDVDADDAAVLVE
jgi:hypothetical protein